MNEAHRRIEASRDHGHPELHLDRAFMGRETEDRAAPILVGKFSKDRWLITHLVPCKGNQHRWVIGKLVNDVIMSGVQTLVVKSDQEASIVDVKNALMRDLRGVEGLTVMPEESPVGASAASAVIERSVWEMQSTTRSLDAYAEWVHGTVSEPGSANLTCAVEFSGQVVSRFQRSVLDGKTAYQRRKLKSNRRKLKSNRKALVPVMEPRDYKARRFYIWREVELAKYGFSDVFEGCRVAQVGAEAKPHSEGYRERIRQAMMNDDVGQQRVRAAERLPDDPHLTPADESQ